MTNPVSVNILNRETADSKCGRLYGTKDQVSLKNKLQEKRRKGKFYVKGHISHIGPIFLN